MRNARGTFQFVLIIITASVILGTVYRRVKATTLLWVSASRRLKSWGVAPSVRSASTTTRTPTKYLSLRQLTVPPPKPEYDPIRINPSLMVSISKIILFKTTVDECTFKVDFKGQGTAWWTSCPGFKIQRKIHVLKNYWMYLSLVIPVYYYT